MPAGHIQDIGNRQHPQPHLHKHGESYLCTALRKYLLQVIMLCQVARIRRSLCGCGGKRSYVRYLLQTEYGQPLNERACSPPPGAGTRGPPHNHKHRGLPPHAR